MRNSNFTRRYYLQNCQAPPFSMADSELTDPLPDWRLACLCRYRRGCCEEAGHCTHDSCSLLTLLRNHSHFLLGPPVQVIRHRPLPRSGPCSLRFPLHLLLRRPRLLGRFQDRQRNAEVLCWSKEVVLALKN